MCKHFKNSVQLSSVSMLTWQRTNEIFEKVRFIGSAKVGILRLQSSNMPRMIICFCLVKRYWIYTDCIYFEKNLNKFVIKQLSFLFMWSSRSHGFLEDQRVSKDCRSVWWYKSETVWGSSKCHMYKKKYYETFCFRVKNLVQKLILYLIFDWQQVDRWQGNKLEFQFDQDRASNNIKETDVSLLTLLV